MNGNLVDSISNLDSLDSFDSLELDRQRKRKERRKTSKQERKLKIQNDGTQEKQKSETSEEVLYVFSVSSYSIRFYTSFYVYSIPFVPERAHHFRNTKRK